MLAGQGRGRAPRQLLYRRRRRRLLVDVGRGRGGRRVPLRLRVFPKPLRQRVAPPLRELGGGLAEGPRNRIISSPARCRVARGLDASSRFPPLLRFPLARVRLFSCADLALPRSSFALLLELALGPSSFFPCFGFGFSRSLGRSFHFPTSFRVGVPPTITPGRLLLAPPLPLDRPSRLVRRALRVQLRSPGPARVAVALRRCRRTALR